MCGGSCPPDLSGAANTLARPQQASPGASGGKLEPGTPHCQAEEVCWGDAHSSRRQIGRRKAFPSSCLTPSCSASCCRASGSCWQCRVWSAETSHSTKEGGSEAGDCFLPGVLAACQALCQELHILSSQEAKEIDLLSPF